MPSIEQISNEVISIKTSSDELYSMVGAASQQLAGSVRQISALVRGSASGQDAVTAINVASRSLGQAATTMAGLSRTCDDVLKSLSR